MALEKVIKQQKKEEKCDHISIFGPKVFASV
jgi:hypothetical protein